VNLYDLDVTEKQRHVGQKVAKVLHILAASGKFHQVFMQNIGFTMHEVRMSGDLKVAYVRWSVYKGCPVDMENRLQANKGRLRSAVGKMLQMKHTPDLQFRRDKLKDHRRELEMAIRELQQEEDGGDDPSYYDSSTGEESDSEGSSGDDDSASDSDVPRDKEVPGRS